MDGPERRTQTKTSEPGPEPWPLGPSASFTAEKSASWMFAVDFDPMGNKERFSLRILRSQWYHIKQYIASHAFCTFRRQIVPTYPWYTKQTVIRWIARNLRRVHIKAPCFIRNSGSAIHSPSFPKVSRLEDISSLQKVCLRYCLMTTTTDPDQLGIQSAMRSDKQMYLHDFGCD